MLINNRNPPSAIGGFSIEYRESIWYNHFVDILNTRNDIMKNIKKLDICVIICGIVAVIAIVIIVLLMISSRGTLDNTYDESTADQSTIDVNAETNEHKDNDSINEDKFGGGEIDPENDEINEENGVDVKAEKLKLESGKSNGIDVSKWQGKTDWTKVKESGIEYAFIRIGYRGENGIIYKDDNADYNIQQAQKAGVLVGVYFFSTAVNEAEAKEEAEWTATAIQGYSISYPVVYDCEGYKKPSSRMNLLSADKRTANAVAFLNSISDEGYEPMFYAARNDVLTNNYWNISDISAKYKVWIAQYPSLTYPERETPEYSGRADAWQYTDKGKVNGIEGNVDMVVCYFERDKADPKNSSSTPTEATAPLTDEEKTYTVVNEQVTAKSITNLRTAATTKSDIVVTLKNGETVTRIGIGTNGWSKLTYNGKTVYAITSYLTTDISTETKAPETSKSEEDGFVNVNDKVTAKIEVNLRKEPNTNSEVVALLKNGVFVERTGTSDKGWSRLIYNGQTVYAVTSYLTTEISDEAEGTTAIAESEPVSDGFKAVDEKVTAKNATNLRTAPSTTNSEVVFTLKNGETVQRIGVHTNGWSKLIYNEQVVYAVSSYLTTDIPETTDVSEETAEPETDNIEGDENETNAA